MGMPACAGIFFRRLHRRKRVTDLCVHSLVCSRCLFTTTGELTMGEEKGFLDKIGDAMDEARAKASEVGSSLVTKAGVAATDAKRSAGKATTAAAKQARSASATMG